MSERQKNLQEGGQALLDAIEFESDQHIAIANEIGGPIGSAAHRFLNKGR
jgi:hypothetical protein